MIVIAIDLIVKFGLYSNTHTHPQRLFKRGRAKQKFFEKAGLKCLSSENAINGEMNGEWHWRLNGHSNRRTDLIDEWVTRQSWEKISQTQSLWMGKYE
jgi:hypothetical protein